MSIRGGLHLLARATERVRRGLLHALFCRGGGLRPTTTPDEQAAGLVVSSRLDEHDLILLATKPLCVTSSYEDWLGRLGLSLDSPPPAERLFFPLAEYKSAALNGLASAEEWIHYCRVERRLALDLFCPAHASPPAHAEGDDVLVIHAAPADD